MINRRPSRSEFYKRMETAPPEENNETFESLARRILTLWQDQIRLTASDVELQGYGTEMFKALGISPNMPTPSTETEQNIKKDAKDHDDSSNQSKFDTSDSGNEDGTAPPEL
ncbi:MAG: hypothetical protein R3261_12745, partial [Alphaproteobacteria bacterium]|nr:hypothetical protein [Alphaproteobacteria bacterium]